MVEHTTRSAISTPPFPLLAGAGRRPVDRPRAIGDAVGVDGLAEPHGVTRVTVAMSMKEPTIAVHTAVAVRELPMVLIAEASEPLIRVRRPAFSLNQAPR